MLRIYICTVLTYVCVCVCVCVCWLAVVAVQGGKSIYGKKFANEVVEGVTHNARGIVSMANSGPNTNASQFFITYAKARHLDGTYRHTRSYACRIVIVVVMSILLRIRGKENGDVIMMMMMMSTDALLYLLVVYVIMQGCTLFSPR